jgi:hypothetical protein
MSTLKETTSPCAADRLTVQSLATQSDSDELDLRYQQVAWKKLGLAPDAENLRLDRVMRPFDARRHRMSQAVAALCPNRFLSVGARHESGSGVFLVH